MKARFEGELILRYRDIPIDGKWFEVVKDFVYIDNNGETYYVPAGTNTDFASIPRGFLWLIDSVGAWGKACAFHDFLCESKKVSRKKADKLFLESMKVLGVGWLTRRTMYSAVRAYSIGTFKK